MLGAPAGKMELLLPTCTVLVLFNVPVRKLVIALTRLVELIAEPLLEVDDEVVCVEVEAPRVDPPNPVV